MGSLAWGEIRRRWRGAVAIGLVLGIGFAAALLAAAGARRTETAYPRMLDVSNTGDVLVGTDIEEPTEREQWYDYVAEAPGVLGTGRIVGVQLVPVEVPRGKGTVVSACAVVSLDGVYGYAIDRPILREGRLPDPRRGDEVLLDPAYAELYGVGVGDRLDFVVVTGAVPAAGETSPSDGDVASATIVGIGTSANQVVPFSDLEAEPRVMAGPGFARAHAPTDDSWCYDAAVLDLDAGVDPDSVLDDIERAGYPQFFQDRQDGVANTRRAIQPQVTALWLFAAVAAAAALLVVGQLLFRQLGQAAENAGGVWRAVGLTSGQVRTLLGAPVLVSAIAGALAATVVAIAFSGRFPIGPARVAEPDPGTAVHWWWHGLAPAAIVVVALALGAFFAWRSTVRREPSRRVGWLARLGSVASRPTAVVGLHLAGASGDGHSAVPVRSSAAGAALSLAAAVAAVTFAASLGDLVSEPARYGRDWDVMVDGLFVPVPIDSILDTFADDPNVEAIAIGRFGEVTIDGERIPTIGLSDVLGTTFPAVIDGRTPARPDEIVVGETTLHHLRRSVGDVVAFDAGDGPRDTTIVGTAAFPKLNQGSFSALALGVGAIARTDAFPPRPLPPGDEFPPGLDPADFVGPDGTLYEFVTMRLRDEATDAARHHVMDTLTLIANSAFAEVRTEQRPAAIDNYAAVRSTPFLLVLLLGGMAAATLGHLVVSVVRRRRHDLALCSALGMQRRQVLGAVVIHALLIAGVALLVALPLGVAGGRLAWQAFSSELGVADFVTLPLAFLGIAALAAAAASISVSGVAGYLTARRRIADVRRRE